MKRHIGIIIFVTLFIAIVSIIAIVFARGYTLQEDELRESGILDIESSPSDAVIYVDGELQNSTPKKIEVTAGEHTVKIEKDGYKVWEKVLFVDSSLVTPIVANLIPSTLEIEQITFTEIEKAFFSPDGSLSLYTITSGSNKGIWSTTLEKSIFELSNTKPTKILELTEIPQECLADSSYEIQISRDNQKAILFCPRSKLDIYKLLNINLPNSDTPLINELIGFNPASVEFGPNSNSLIISDNEIIAALKLDSNSRYLLARKSGNFTPVISFRGKSLIVLNDSFDNQSKTLTIFDSNFNSSTPDISAKIDQINDISGPLSDEVTMFSTSGAKGSYIYYEDNYDKPIKFSDKEVEVFGWAPDGMHFLFIQEEQLRSGFIRILPDNSVKVKTYEIIDNFVRKNWEYDWGHSSERLLFQNNEEKKIYSYDFDGQNKTLLYDGPTSLGGSFCFSKNETFVVVQVKDAKNSSNLYTVKLKI